MQTTTDTTSAPTTTERDTILNLLETFIRSRPGLEFANYGDAALYRAESRSITKDRDHALTLLRYVRWTSIDAAALREAFRGAYSGRLSLGTDAKGRMCLNYCTGQYYPTEYRRAACAVLASAIWAYWRDHCMPEPSGYRVKLSVNDSEGIVYSDRAFANTALEEDGYASGYVLEVYGPRHVSAGDWLRAKARAEFGRAIASRWFN